jgi:hypothetical protein
VLCTELGKGDLAGEQLDFVMRLLQESRDDGSVDHVFLFMHRVIWFYGHERYRHVARLGNNSSMEDHLDINRQLGGRRAFWRVLFPELRRLARVKPAYLFAGDVGRRAPLIYDRLDGVHLLATGCRGYCSEQTWNHIVEVCVKGRKVWLHTVSLDGLPLAEPPHYDLQYWAGLALE